MSFKMLQWAWEQDLDPQAKLVLLFLADSHNSKDGRCHPSVPAIARATGLSVSTTRRRLQDLEGRRLIASSPRHLSNKAALSNAYTLDPPVSVTPPVRETAPPVSLTGPPVTADRAYNEEPEENLEENHRGLREGRDLSEGGDLSLDVELNGKGRGSVGRAANGYAWKPNGRYRH